VSSSSSDGDSPGSSPVENLQSDSPPSQLGAPAATPSLAVTSDGASSAESPPRRNPPTQETGADTSIEELGIEMQAAEDGESLILREPVHRINLADYDCVDPFGSTSVQITSQVQIVLDHLLKVYTYSGNNYKLAHLPQHLAATMPRFPIRSVVQRSVYKEHHLYSLMAASTARMKHVFCINSPFSDPKQVRTIAIHHLRKELVASARSGIVDKQTILDLLYLVVNEIQYGYFDDARRHLEIVGKLYGLLDSNEYLDRWISETAAHVDNQLALSTGSLPVLPYDFDPGPMLPERMGMLKREAQRLLRFGCPSPTSLVVPRAPEGLNDAVADLAATLDLRMGSRFSFALKIGAFTGKLAKVVSDLVDCIEIAKVVWLSPLAVCFDAEWLCRKARSVLRALLKLAPEHTPGPIDLYSKCTENARICLMILMTHACTMIGHQTARSNVKRLQRSSRAALEYWCPSIGWTFECQPVDPDKRLPMFQDTQAGFVLWAMFTGIWCAEGVAEEDWFMVRAVSICRYFGYYTYDDLHDHMAHYLYAKTLQEPSLRKTAQLLQTLPRNYA
jgi:hypothetical protein